MYVERAIEVGVHPEPHPMWGEPTTEWEQSQIARLGASRLFRGSAGNAYSGPTQHHAMVGRLVDHTDADAVAGAVGKPYGYMKYHVRLPDGATAVVAQEEPAGPWARALAGLPPLD